MPTPLRAPQTITAPSAKRIEQHARQKIKRPIILRRGDLVVGDRIGNATFEGFNRTHSFYWHKQRATGIGGSDVAALCGVSKYSSAFKMWNERTGRIARVDDGKNANAKLWGQKLEKIILEVFAQKHPDLMVLTWSEGWGASFRSALPGREYQLASPDGLTYDPATGQWGIVEVKTARYDYEWKDPDILIPIVPAYYMTQDQWYLDAFGWDDSWFSVLFAGSDYQEFNVPADPFEQATNRDQAERFLQYVADDVPPDWDGSDATYEVVRRLSPEIDPDADPFDLGPLGDELLMEVRAFKAQEWSLQAKKSEVLATMGRAKDGIVQGVKVVSRQANRSKTTPSGWGQPYLKMKVE